MFVERAPGSQGVSVPRPRTKFPFLFVLFLLSPFFFFFSFCFFVNSHFYADSDFGQKHFTPISLSESGKWGERYGSLENVTAGL